MDITIIANDGFEHSFAGKHYDDTSLMSLVDHYGITQSNLMDYVKEVNRDVLINTERVDL